MHHIIFVYINIIYGISNSQSTLFLVKVINFLDYHSLKFKGKPLMIRNLIQTSTYLLMRIYIITYKLSIYYLYLHIIVNYFEIPTV